MANFNFWKGNKVRLRGIEPKDADCIFEWNLDSEASRNADAVLLPRSFERVKSSLEEASKNEHDGDSYFWGIENEEGELVGTISTFECNRRVGTFKYGIFIARPYWDKGYGKEAVQLVIKYYFMELGYQKITSYAYSFNERSIKFHEKLGFQKEGQLRRMYYTNGKYYDAIYFGMIKEEFKSIVERE
jgi:RimJ/RimL family protein N-acetyltransferase